MVSTGRLANYLMGPIGCMFDWSPDLRVATPLPRYDDPDVDTIVGFVVFGISRSSCMFYHCARALQVLLFVGFSQLNLGLL